MSTDKPASKAFAVPITVDPTQPGATADQLFNALTPLFYAIAGQFTGAARDEFWGTAAGAFAGTCTGSIGIAKSALLLQKTAAMVADHAAIQVSTHGRPN